MTRPGLWIWVGLVGGTTAALGSPDDEPAGFVRIRTKPLATIDRPAFVAGKDAQIPGNAWVLGVLADGEARAYSLDLLSHHEVVNDRSKYLDFGVVWSAAANAAAVIDRRLDGRSLTFDSAGGVVRGSPILKDRETGTHWSLVDAEAIRGPLKGRKLEHLSIGRRVLWKDWIARYPETVILSVGGTTHWYSGASERYFASADGVAGISAEDRRLATKAPVFAFSLHARAHAIAHVAIEGGRVFEIEGSTVFVYRRPKAAPFESTVAYIGQRFERQDDAWVEARTSCRFDEASAAFTGSRCPKPLEGLDTFWFVWSLNHPETALLW
jgi:hypothetical protein